MSIFAAFAFNPLSSSAQRAELFTAGFHQRRLNAVAAAAILMAGSGLSHGKALDLEEALRIAVTQHPSVAARQNELRAARSKVDLAERQRYPGLVAQSAKDSAGSQVTTLRLEQPIWTGGRITAEIESANASVQQAEAGVQQSQQDIMLKVAASFTELGRIQARLEAAQSNVEEHSRLDSMIQRRVESNVSPSSDGVQARGRLAQARAEVSQLEGLALRAKASLSQSTGQPVDSIVVPKKREYVEIPLDSLITTALQFSPALRRLDGEYAALTAEIALRKSSALPQVKMRIDHNVGGTSKGTNAYLALDVQTGAGFSAFAAVQEIEARRDAIQSQMEVIKRETIDAVSAEWADLQSFLLQVRDLRAQVESTTAVFDSFVRQYAVGRKGWNDVLNAQREVTQARYQLADADWGTLRASLRIEMLTGVMTVENYALLLNGSERAVARATGADTPASQTVSAAPSPTSSQTVWDKVGASPEKQETVAVPATVQTDKAGGVDAAALTPAPQATAPEASMAEEVGAATDLKGAQQGVSSIQGPGAATAERDLSDATHSIEKPMDQAGPGVATSDAGPAHTPSIPDVSVQDNEAAREAYLFSEQTGQADSQVQWIEAGAATAMPLGARNVTR